MSPYLKICNFQFNFDTNDYILQVQVHIVYHVITKANYIYSQTDIPPVYYSGTRVVPGMHNLDMTEAKT